MKFLFFPYRPTDVDALFLGHALFVLHALPVFVCFNLFLIFMLKPYEFSF
jgi:hypothetical protein